MSGIKINSGADQAESITEVDANKLKRINLDEVTDFYSNKIGDDLEKAE